MAPAHADDEALYGPAAPAGSAFIRILNASDEDGLEAHVGNEIISGVGAWDVSEFVFLPAGTHSLTAGDAKQSVELTADRYYTAVIGADGVRMIDNERFGNRLKALLILYNLTDDEGLSLRTADGATPVIEEVDPFSYGTREVNAARVSLALFDDDQRVADTEPLSLKRGKALSLFAVGPSTSPRLVWTVN